MCDRWVAGRSVKRERAVTVTLRRDAGNGFRQRGCAVRAKQHSRRDSALCVGEAVRVDDICPQIVRPLELDTDTPS